MYINSCEEVNSILSDSLRCASVGKNIREYFDDELDGIVSAHLLEKKFASHTHTERKKGKRENWGLPIS